jgi:hypothetical protein
MIDKIFTSDKIDQVLAKIAPQYSISDTESQIKTLLEASLDHPETRVTHHVYPEIYYLSNPKLDYYIKLDKSSITVSNHTYTYREGLSDKFSKILYRVVDIHTESTVKKFEEEVFKNKTDLLNRIIKQLQIKN